MYGPGDALPGIYEEHFRTQMYDDRIDHYHKLIGQGLSQVGTHRARLCPAAGSQDVCHCACTSCRLTQANVTFSSMSRSRT